MSAASLLMTVIRNAAESGSADIDWMPDYAEPGYSMSGEHGILFANWNPKTFQRGYSPSDSDWRPEVPTFESRVGKIAEALGIDIEWSDEWTRCDECGRAIRTQPDSHGWEPSYALIGCEGVCAECIRSDFTDEHEEELCNNPERADTLDIDWYERGWHRVPDRQETGFHPGQNDNPHDWAKRFDDVGKCDYLFSIDGSGQFDTQWSVWVRPKSFDPFA